MSPFLRLHVACVAAIVLFALSGCTRAPQAPSPWPVSTGPEEGPPHLVEYLAGLGPTELLSVHQIEIDRQAIEDARNGRFLVSERPVELNPPVDWLQDPYDDRSWRFWLHSLVVLEPLFRGYETTGDTGFLERAVDLSVDWLDQNPPGQSGLSRFAWYDMAVPARAAYFAYLLRAAAVAGVLEHSEALALALGIEQHASWLMKDRNYTAGHNHGLYQDAGLFLVARQLSDHPRSEPWRSTATERFARTLRQTVAVDEGMHLEHSPGYHVTVTELLTEFVAYGIDDDLPALVERMRASAGWLVMPDETHPQLGDTDRLRVPDWVLESARGLEGLALFSEAGYGIVKTPESYLILAAGYHGRGHKHADELTVSLYDRDRRILVDAGRWGYYYDEPERIYAVSSRAHNGVEFGGLELVWRGQEPYGSGLLGGARDGDWYAIAATNPLLVQRDTDHRRLVLYAPGRQLVLIDRVELAEPTSVTRYLHFAPKLRPRLRGRGVLSASWPLSGGDGFRGRVCDLSGRDVAARNVSAIREPEMQGFTFPANRVRRASPTLILEGTGGSGFWVTAIDLVPGGLCAGGLSLRVDWNGEPLELDGPGGSRPAGSRIDIGVVTPEVNGGGETGLVVSTSPARP